VFVATRLSRPRSPVLRSSDPFPGPSCPAAATPLLIAARSEMQTRRAILRLEHEIRSPVKADGSKYKSCPFDTVLPAGTMPDNL